MKTHKRLADDVFIYLFLIFFIQTTQISADGGSDETQSYACTRKALPGAFDIILNATKDPRIFDATLRPVQPGHDDFDYLSWSLAKVLLPWREPISRNRHRRVKNFNDSGMCIPLANKTSNAIKLNDIGKNTEKEV